MDKKNISYPFCLSIDRNGFAYCSAHNHCSGLFFMDELLCMKEAIEKTILAYKKEGITDSYIEDEDKKAMETEFSRLNGHQKDARGVIVDDLYLIQDTYTNLLKIGRSKNAESRKKTMQTAIGNRLELLFVIKGCGYKELELHDKFAKYRKHGEWFEYDKTIIDEFVSLGGVVRESIYTDKEKELKEKADSLFETCWLAYRRKGKRGKAYPYWKKLSEKEKTQVLPHIRAYTQTRELQYQQDFERYLRDKTFMSLVFQNSTVIYDPTRFEKGVYTPQGRTIWFNEETKSYWSTYNFYDERIYDGYTDEERPDGAEITLNNARGTYKWNSNNKKWERK